MVLVNIHTYRNRTQWYCTTIYYNYTAIYYIQLLYYIQLFSNVVGNNHLQAVTVVRVAVNCIQAVNNFPHTRFCLSCTAHHTLHFPNFSVEEHLSSSLSRKTYILSHYDTLDTRHVQKSLQSTTQVSSVPLPNGHVSLLKYQVHELPFVQIFIKCWYNIYHTICAYEMIYAYITGFDISTGHMWITCMQYDVHAMYTMT